MGLNMPDCTLVLGPSTFLSESSFSACCLCRLSVWKSSSSAPGQSPEPMPVSVPTVSNVFPTQHARSRRGSKWNGPFL